MINLYISSVSCHTISSLARSPPRPRRARGLLLLCSILLLLLLMCVYIFILIPIIISIVSIIVVIFVIMVIISSVVIISISVIMGIIIIIIIIIIILTRMSLLRLRVAARQTVFDTAYSMHTVCMLMQCVAYSLIVHGVYIERGYYRVHTSCYMAACQTMFGLSCADFTIISTTYISTSDNNL